MNDMVRLCFRLIAVATVLLLPLAGVRADSAQTLEDARSAYERGDYSAAYEGFLSLAETGNLDAQFELGYIYDFGEGVARSACYGRSVLAVKQLVGKPGRADRGRANIEWRAQCGETRSTFVRLDSE